MVVYSHSRLSTFEQCPLKFKYRYIDKIIPEIEKTIEIHLGSTVHDALEWLYIQIQNKKLPTIDEIIVYYAEKWEENYKPEIIIVKNGITTKDYFNKGVQFILNYYTKNHPFDDGTIEIEKKILINLDEEGKYKLQGFIDRLVHNIETGKYEVHDYKTANFLPKQEKFENDRQLALYSIGVKDLFGQDKEVLLIWHYLAHNQKICSCRTNEQLKILKSETIKLINKIEATEKFPSQITKLCNWCEYKSMCPKFGKKIPEQKTKKLDKQKSLDIWD